jgi:aminoglycoside phosphotransferase (APT) family kinase protein
MSDLDSMRVQIEIWLAARLSHATRLSVSPLHLPRSAGNSAETIFVDVAWTVGAERQSKRFVLRRAKEGSELFLNADIGFPWRVMEAMAAYTDIPVPPLMALESDRSVLGSPFFVTECVAGQIAPQSPNYNLEGWIAALPAQERGQVWRNGLQTLARIHAIDWRAGFSFLANGAREEVGLPQYVAWIGDWLEWAKRGRPQPVLDAALDYLRRRMPRQRNVSVLWGDSQPSNLLFAPDGSVACVLDWEMAALGPGEVDLAWWLFFDDLYSEGMRAPRLAGLPDRKQSIEIYEEFSGYPVRNMDYYDMVARVRMGIISIRGYDRMLADGKIKKDSNAITHNPMTQSIAQRLGIPVPVVGEDFLALVKAVGER